MHEMSIAESILETARNEAGLRHGRPTGIGIRVGELSGVEPESLRFCFEAIAGGIRLAIEFLPASDELNYSYLEIEDNAACDLGTEGSQ